MNKEGLEGSSYAEWFVKGMNTYTPDPVIINQLKPSLSKYTITAFMGTWCGDSKREIPKLYKVLESAEFPMERLTVIGVDRKREVYKQSPGGEQEGLNIHRVPTIILYKNGIEVNRIVESTLASMEKDLHDIITGVYSNKHQLVTNVNNLLTEYGIEKFYKKSLRKKKKLQAIAKNAYQLNTYANVLYFAGEKEKALEILKFNTQLFPEEAVTYSNLGTKLFGENQLKDALAAYKKAALLDPENKKIKADLDQIKQKLNI